MQVALTVPELVAQGRFKESLEAIRALPQDRRRTPDIMLAEAESLMETGDLQRASLAAERTLQGQTNPVVRVKSLRFLGQIAFNEGDGRRCGEFLRLARSIAFESRAEMPDLHAAILLITWRLLGGTKEYGASEVDFNELRRAVLRSGSAHSIVELRAGVAELEARKSNPHEALRHLECARDLLQAHPNMWLEGLIDNHTSHVFAILGDTDKAVSSALQSIERTAISGHFRVRLSAQINLADLYRQSGELDLAADTLYGVLRAVGSHAHLQAAALDGLVNVSLSNNDLGAARAAFGQLLALRRHNLKHLNSSWFRLSEMFSRARLFEVGGNRVRAYNLMRRGLHLAHVVSDRMWENRIRIYLSRLASELGHKDESVNHLLSVQTGYSHGPDVFAQACNARASAERLVGNATQATKLEMRAARVSEGLRTVIGNAVIQSESLQTGARLHQVTPTLEDATALIELAGYPHVLAREAFALLEMSGAADAQALIARGPGIRCLATRIWTEAEAVAAAKAPRLQILCGVHRNESWEVIATPKPELHHLCAAISVQKLVETAVTLDRYRREEKQRAALWPADTMETDGGLWVSEQMVELLGIARRVASSPITVLVTGETGTGKEVLARAIHRASSHGAKPFVPFNCTAVARDMLESQLFGYRKGAFTGADVAFDGIIRGAAGGTLFLDEIAEIGPELQPKLLRFLETHEVHGLGEAHPVKVDVRVIAATNADVDALVRDGRFREDLLYRLDGVRLHLPPLRERREEIPPLVEYYLRTFADEQAKGRLTLDDETLEYLVLYGWPGNVRQLVNEIRRMVAFAEPNGRLTPALLSADIQASRRTVRVLPGDEPEIRVRLDQSLNEAVDTIERVMIRRALERAHGNYENAARLLGISRKGLFLKRRRWGLERAS